MFHLFNVYTNRNVKMTLEEVAIFWSTSDGHSHFLESCRHCEVARQPALRPETLHRSGGRMDKLLFVKKQGDAIDYGPQCTA